MAAAKKHPKTGGRKKGTPNKVTAATRELLSKFVDDKWEEFVAAYEDIKDPEKKCSIMVQVLAYVAPKMATVEYKGEVPVKTFNDELDEITGEKTRT